MKNVISFISIFFLLFFLFTVVVSAHTLKASGSVGAVMHVQPEDDPIAGEESSFFFEFKDKKNLFTSQACDCTFYILQDGQQIYSQELFENSHDPSLTNASVFYTFPTTGIYKVKVDGKPTDGSFEPFVLEYDVRVERTSSSDGAIQNDGSLTKYTPHIVGGLIGLSALAFFALSQRRKQIKE